MKRISYAGGSITTGDQLAEAVMEYATVLARTGGADAVTIPAVSDDGGIFAVELLVGPASQLVVAPVESDYQDPDSPEAIGILYERTARLRPGERMADRSSALNQAFDDLEIPND
jgi:hypothetical protein